MDVEKRREIRQRKKTVVLIIASSVAARDFVALLIQHYNYYNICILVV